MIRSSADTAREVVRGVPPIMSAIRAEMRRRLTRGLSVPQFRALGFVHRHPGRSLSDSAEHIGLTMSAMSRLIEGLVKRRLMTRGSHSADRRRVTLGLTWRGRRLLESALAATEAALADRLAALGSAEAAVVVRAMRILQPLFSRNEAREKNERAAGRPSGAARPRSERRQAAGAARGRRKGGGRP